MPLSVHLPVPVIEGHIKCQQQYEEKCVDKIERALIPAQQEEIGQHRQEISKCHEHEFPYDGFPVSPTPRQPLAKRGIYNYNECCGYGYLETGGPYTRQHICKDDAQKGYKYDLFPHGAVNETFLRGPGSFQTGICRNGLGSYSKPVFRRRETSDDLECDHNQERYPGSKYECGWRVCPYQVGSVQLRIVDR